MLKLSLDVGQFGLQTGRFGWRALPCLEAPAAAFQRGQLVPQHIALAGSIGTLLPHFDDACQRQREQIVEGAALEQATRFRFAVRDFHQAMIVETDRELGHVTPHVLGRLAGCHALMLESNHDPDMLARSRYPDFLKRRVGGPHGHLSNAQAAHALRALRHDRLGTVVAAHLSERNNLPQLVRDAFADALGCASGDVLVTSRHGLDWLRA